jgi:hypothetical protein
LQFMIHWQGFLFYLNKEGTGDAHNSQWVYSMLNLAMIAADLYRYSLITSEDG